MNKYWYVNILAIFDEFLDVGMKEKRACVVAEMKRLQAEAEPITKIFEDDEISKSIQSTRSVCVKMLWCHLTSVVFE